MTVATKDYWIQTLSGKKFSYVDPQPESISRYDIISSLSREPRYAGQTYRTYTVGEHSVLCSKMITPKYAIQAFAHDFAEAYIKDIPHPLKKLIREISNGHWRTIEDRIMLVICDKFSIGYPFPREVKEVDLRMMATERRQLLGKSPAPWGHDEEPYDIEIECWSSDKTATNMMYRWRELGLHTGE